VIRYDNLKDAVIKVLLGRARLENQRFMTFRSTTASTVGIAVRASRALMRKAA
jgi:hypothetical protein